MQEPLARQVDNLLDEAIHLAAHAEIATTAFAREHFEGQARYALNYAERIIADNGWLVAGCAKKLEGARDLVSRIRKYLPFPLKSVVSAVYSQCGSDPQTRGGL